MLIGVPKEIKTHEYRVGLIPASVRELVLHGHQVTVQAGACGSFTFTIISASEKISSAVAAIAAPAVR